MCKKYMEARCYGELGTRREFEEEQRRPSTKRRR